MIELRTITSDERGTVSVIFVDDVICCWALELPWKNNRQNISCVPAGEYPLVLEYSPRFNDVLWELKDVPGRSECKIHPANLLSQLSGCIAPGLDIKCGSNGYRTIQSRMAHDKFLKAVGGRKKEALCISGRVEFVEKSCIGS